MHTGPGKVEFVVEFVVGEDIVALYVFSGSGTPKQGGIFVRKIIYPVFYRNFRKNCEISEPGCRNVYKTDPSSEV